MNNILHIFFLFIIISGSLFSFGQETCKVLIPQLEGTYNGGCKKGLANGNGSAKGTDLYEGHFINGLPDGQGTYTWANGASYKGKWKMGRKNGEGEYTFPVNGKDSTIFGSWLNDAYIGPAPRKPEILYKSGVDRYVFRKTGNFKKRVLIDIYQNGSRNPGISNFMISSSSGYETRLGYSSGYDDVSFPVTIKVSFTSWNKLRTATYYVEFEFEIFESGDWSVSLHN